MSRWNRVDAVHEIRVGLRPGPPQQLEPRQDVGEEVVVVLAPPRREDADRYRGPPSASGGRQRRKTGCCDGRGRAVVGREVEEERVVLRHDRAVGRKHAAAPDGGDDVGGNVLASMCRELRVVGRAAPPEAAGADPAAAATSTTSTPPPGWARVVGRRARHVARRRRAGQAAGQRADRLRGVQHARLEPREERAQRARAAVSRRARASLLDTSRERGRPRARAGHRSRWRRGWRIGRGARCTGCGRSLGTRPTRAAGWRPSGAPSSGTGGPGTGATPRGDRDGGRAHAACVVRPQQFSAVWTIYDGVHEWEELQFCLRYLRPGDHFVDVGANVGVFSTLVGHADPGRAHHRGGALPAGARRPASPTSR